MPAKINIDIDDVEIRFCKNPKCGKQLIKRQTEATTRFADRKFCNHTCYGQHIASLKPERIHYHDCIVCFCPMIPKENEFPHEYNKRLTCSYKCTRIHHSNCMRQHYTEGTIAPKENHIVLGLQSWPENMKDFEDAITFDNQPFRQLPPPSIYPLSSLSYAQSGEGSGNGED